MLTKNNFERWQILFERFDNSSTILAVNISKINNEEIQTLFLFWLKHLIRFSISKFLQKKEKSKQ